MIKNYLEDQKKEKESTINMFLFGEHDFCKCDGIGPIIQRSIKNWKQENISSLWLAELLSEINIVDDYEMPDNSNNALDGITFVITGSLSGYANRDEMKHKIESLGGKVSGSVSKKTHYLINNDLTSTSGKNQKAKSLGIPIISELEFEAMISEV